ncbi:hypothetical protein [Endozoicomonas ascidiicola]|uniref:hypothetical protein n=1 Tax=Endozoicomonas ascidiicola TaxID=1698521 RepID=UPI0008370959|nr:hypothetical protein [Endozoicomonas ascidiicola]
MKNDSNDVSAFLIDQTGIFPVKLQLRNDYGLSHIKELIECPKGILASALRILPCDDAIFFANKEEEYGIIFGGYRIYGDAIVVGSNWSSGDLIDVNMTFSQLASEVIIDNVLANVFSKRFAHIFDEEKGLS